MAQIPLGLIPKWSGVCVRPDIAASRLRDAIQIIWGELADRARRTGHEEIQTRKTNLNSDWARATVAKYVAPAQDAVPDVASLLENIHLLHADLSSPAKDPLSEDRSRVEDLYSRWHLHLHALFPR